MEVTFDDKELDRLETDPKFTGGKPLSIIKVYRKRMQIIRAAPDERDFYKLRSLHFEKLEGKRKRQHSMRLNNQYRLILELLKDNPQGTIIRIVGIEDYH